MDKGFITQQITSEIELIAGRESEWLANQGSLSTLSGKAIPEDQQEQHRSNANYMGEVAAVLSSARVQLERILEQVNGADA
ncbi:hypothetical protein [Rufibacter sp. XAAS-G3-1]|uniref:hypothetical protein n=1 Tax=Rufibacter sp. XAAS-G3-1 TaxID=2729134 RepID=UPI0015E6E1B0|nr:hypothetical protein [Rufibacter sp. XAAS-G3-1]